MILRSGERFFRILALAVRVCRFPESFCSPDERFCQGTEQTCDATGFFAIASELFCRPALGARTIAGRFMGGACRDRPTTNVFHATRSARRSDPTAPRLGLEAAGRCRRGWVRRLGRPCACPWPGSACRRGDVDPPGDRGTMQCAATRCLWPFVLSPDGRGACMRRGILMLQAKVLPPAGWGA